MKPKRHSHLIVIINCFCSHLSAPAKICVSAPIFVKSHWTVSYSHLHEAFFSFFWCSVQLLSHSSFSVSCSVQIHMLLFFFFLYAATSHFSNPVWCVFVWYSFSAALFLILLANWSIVQQTYKVAIKYYTWFLTTCSAVNLFSFGLLKTLEHKSYLFVSTFYN